MYVGLSVGRRACKLLVRHFDPAALLLLYHLVDLLDVNLLAQLREHPVEVAILSRAARQVAVPVDDSKNFLDLLHTALIETVSRVVYRLQAL